MKPTHRVAVTLLATSLAAGCAPGGTGPGDEGVDARHAAFTSSATTVGDWSGLPDGVECLVAQPGGEDGAVGVPGVQGAQDPDDLLGGLARSVDHLGVAGAGGTVEVDPGESQVLGAGVLAHPANLSPGSQRLVATGRSLLVSATKHVGPAAFRLQADLHTLMKRHFPGRTRPGMCWFICIP